MDQNRMKRISAIRAIEYLDDNESIGIGTGTTVEFFIEELSRIRNKFVNKKFYASSQRTMQILLNLGLDVREPDRILDVYIDGADSVDRNLNMIKGGGGALTREKILAFNSKKRIIIVDETKVRKNIFSFPMPVEIIPFSSDLIKLNLINMKLKFNLRKFNENPFVTDNGNFILDVFLENEENPFDIAHKIKLLPGVVEIGLFEDLADIIIIGKENFEVEEIKKVP
ncbi:MAG: ribose-5-phosphate isomerase RpiA [Thermoplasmata archaeon]